MKAYKPGWEREKKISPFSFSLLFLHRLHYKGTPSLPLHPTSAHLPPHSHTNGHPTATERTTKSEFPELLLLVRKNVAPLVIQSRPDLATDPYAHFPGSPTLPFSSLLKRSVHAYLYTNIHHQQNLSLGLKTRRALKGTGSRLCFQADKLLSPL